MVVLLVVSSDWDTNWLLYLGSKSESESQRGIEIRIEGSLHKLQTINETYLTMRADGYSQSRRNAQIDAASSRRCTQSNGNVDADSVNVL